MKHGSLFSGIGGFDHAADLMGWENIFHCEINPFCQTVLKYHFQNSIQHHDITKTNFSIYRGRIDVITGGFPCQPFSSAGKQLGTEDTRHLWPEMLRAIREIQPSWIVGENVRGLVNWSGGLVFEQVQADLEAEGYEVIPFILPACAVDANHRRDRVWFVAHSKNTRRKQSHKKNENRPPEQFNGNSVQQITTNTVGIRLQGEQLNRGTEKTGTIEGESRLFERSICNKWKIFPSKPPVCSGNDGVSGRLDGITFSKWRQESIKAYGNAVVPPLVLEIFKAIELYNT